MPYLGIRYPWYLYSVFCILLCPVVLVLELVLCLGFLLCHLMGSQTSRAFENLDNIDIDVQCTLKKRKSFSFIFLHFFSTISTNQEGTLMLMHSIVILLSSGTNTRKCNIMNTSYRMIQTGILCLAMPMPSLFWSEECCDYQQIATWKYSNFTKVIWHNSKNIYSIYLVYLNDC